MTREHDDFVSPPSEVATRPSPARTTPLIMGSSLDGVAHAPAGMRHALLLGLQRSAGNASVARAIHQRAEGSTLSRRTRQPPMGTVTDDTGSRPIEGAVVTSGPETDPEVLREQQIARTVPQVTQQARLRLLETRSHVTSAVESFRDYATNQIDAMDSAPSGYWGLVRTGAGLIGTIVTAAFPAGGATLAIGVAVASAIQGAVQTDVTEEETAELARLRENAKRAMRQFATQTRDGFDAAVTNLTGSGTGGPIHKSVYDLSVTDDEARMRLESGQEPDLNAICDRIGVPPPSPDIFDRILTGLQQEFGEWKATQEFNEEHTRMWQMVAEADPGSEVGRERRRMRAEGRAAGGAAAQQAIEERRRAQGYSP
jgi:hypothetical protein